MRQEATIANGIERNTNPRRGVRVKAQQQKERRKESSKGKLLEREVWWMQTKLR